MAEEYIHIGYTQRAHGLHGEIKLSIQPEYEADLDYLEVLFLHVGGHPTPYFIKQMRFGNHLLVKFEGIENRSAAELISSKKILVRTSDLVLKEGESPHKTSLEYAFCEGYTLIDELKGTLGVIEEILDYPQQEMASLQYQNKHLLIPLHKQFIRQINEDTKSIYVNLPEGILEL